LAYSSGQAKPKTALPAAQLKAAAGKSNDRIKTAMPKNGAGEFPSGGSIAEELHLLVVVSNRFMRA
jgi:hypothetical protein